jgi:membrane protein
LGVVDDLLDTGNAHTYLSNELQTFLDANEFTEALKILELLPYLIIWFLFFLIYKISANVDISNRSAGISSFAVSLTWYMAKIGFVSYVLQNQTYATLYGSFSTLIFFFLWVYLSWIIFIYGLKLCYTIEKVAEEARAEESKQIEKSLIEDGQNTEDDIEAHDPDVQEDLDNTNIKT